MEYQKIANLIDDNTLNQPSKFRTRNWIEINDESRVTYNVNSQIKFKTTMLKSSLCDYSDVYILVKGTITVNNTAAQGAAANNTNKKVIFKNCAPFTNCISESNNMQIDNAKDIDTVMPMYNLIEYSDNYAKKQEVYGNIVKIYQLEMLIIIIIIIILLFLQRIILLIHLRLKQKSLVKLEMMEQKMLK